MRDQNPKSKRIHISFDRAELQNRLQKFTFREARRHHGSFYKALVQELLEDGCLTTAKYFNKFSAQEDELYRNTVIRDRVVNDPHLLMSLYDNCKMAERSALLEQCEGITVTFNLLYQVMCLLQQPQYEVKFNWLMKEIFEVIVRICDKLGAGKSNVDRPISQIYLKYAKYLIQNSDDLPSALNYYEKSLALVQANKWISEIQKPGTATFGYLHEIVVLNYSEALLKYGATIAPNDYVTAVDLSRKALGLLTQVGNKEANLHYFASAYLSMAEFYIEGREYKVAHKVLQTLANEMPRIDPLHIESVELRWFMDQGICYTQLDQNEKSMECLRKALELSRKLKVKTREAEAHMYIGKLYLHAGAQQRSLAKRSLANSIKLYKELNDMKSRKKNIYLIAQSINATLFPLILDLMRKSEQYCDYFYLRSWKNHLHPFWHGQYLREDSRKEPNKVQCLLNEFVVNDKIKNLLKI